MNDNSFVWLSSLSKTKLLYPNRQQLYQALHRYVNSDYGGNEHVLKRRFRCVSNAGRYFLGRHGYSSTPIRMQVASLLLSPNNKLPNLSMYEIVAVYG
jgi:hypothetical protein